MQRKDSYCPPLNPHKVRVLILCSKFFQKNQHRIHVMKLTSLFFCFILARVRILTSSFWIFNFLSTHFKMGFDWVELFCEHVLLLFIMRDGITKSCPNSRILSIRLGQLISLNIAIIVVASKIFKIYPKIIMPLSFICLMTCSRGLFNNSAARCALNFCFFTNERI